jgi:protein-S-isoprenylcysteine O-methyltransferase Ste14
VTWIDLGLALIAAALLGLERYCYLAVWRAPDAFRRAITTWAGAEADPVTALANVFVGFKVLQAVVFAGWCLFYGGGEPFPPGRGLAPFAAGTALILVGQILNAAVFAKLGMVGVFYGNRFGHEVSWRSGFPFSWLRHPQYVGTVATIWGVFLVFRYPAPDWIVLPLIETAYYVAGSWLEEDTGDSRASTAPSREQA